MTYGYYIIETLSKEKDIKKEKHIMEYTIVEDTSPSHNKHTKCCCNCLHCNRVPDKNDPKLVSHNECAIDKHYIGYLATFDDVCDNWTRETKWD